MKWYYEYHLFEQEKAAWIRRCFRVLPETAPPNAAFLMVIPGCVRWITVKIHLTHSGMMGGQNERIVV